MTTRPRPKAAAELVSCEVCHREIPFSEANHFEAEDYVAHFCGLDCYSEWKQRSRAPDRKQQEDKR
jgi:hypothetical protein